MENKTRYIKLEFPNNSDLMNKVRHIKKKTGIKSNIGAVIHALLSYKDDKE